MGSTLSMLTESSLAKTRGLARVIVVGGKEEKMTRSMLKMLEFALPDPE